jgi:pimeloyl-ACP methyl ester carboxylesterase
MPGTLQDSTALTTPTLFAETRGRRLAYRSIGSGTPLILCVRFRGVLDVWDPAFLDALAASFRVIIFDYSGLGQSSGEADYTPSALARDAIDLADALGLDRFVAGGWSLGGQAAQALTKRHPDRVSHLVLIGTAPPGKLNHGPEHVFFERALKFDNDLDDEIVLFFEPKSARSRAAATQSHDRLARRTDSRSPVVPEATYLRLLGSGGGDLFPDTDGYAAFLQDMEIPILVISGDHEIVFPVHNWCDRIGVWSSLHLLVIPQAGHGAHHQEPEFCADAIRNFVRNIE